MVPLFETIPKVTTFDCFTLPVRYSGFKSGHLQYTVISAKYATCAVVSVNGTLVEAKMCIFTLESMHFSFSKCPIYTHDGALPNLVLTQTKRITVYRKDIWDRKCKPIFYNQSSQKQRLGTRRMTKLFEILEFTSKKVQSPQISYIIFLYLIPF